MFYTILTDARVYSYPWWTFTYYLEEEKAVVSNTFLDGGGEEWKTEWPIKGKKAV